jgi:hypothetical protein
VTSHFLQSPPSRTAPSSPSTITRKPNVGRPRMDPRPKNGIRFLDSGDGDGAAAEPPKFIVVVVDSPTGATSYAESYHYPKVLLFLLVVVLCFLAHGPSPSILLGNGLCSGSRVRPSSSSPPSSPRRPQSSSSRSSPAGWHAQNVRL